MQDDQQRCKDLEEVYQEKGLVALQIRNRPALKLMKSDYLDFSDFVLPIKEANMGLLLASSFFVFAILSAAPGFGVLAAFFIR